jgi:hypothetical protein
MEIEENVNPGVETRQFSKIALKNRKNMESQLVVCDSRSRTFSLNVKDAIYGQTEGRAISDSTLYVC